ncbi:sulfate/molybdate ABC transporter ATP-binding protein [Neobacillus sp. SCS-31]|uniref:sulfate/molybdate ABC transporter ATP-binding protein n=1 Tax=Neobacillus oceani TaxID=3115292 RepID=UPI003905DFA4
MSISIKNASKLFSEFPAVQNVNLEIKSGDFIALLGPSGSGKTTLLRMIAGLEGLDSGNIFFNGNDYTDKHVKERGIGFVFQHYALFKHMTVFENIAFGLKVRPRHLRPSKEEVKRKVGELLKLVQLEEMGGRYPSQLSGGQRQRIALARALAVEPEVLLLDEPFGALDAKVRQELRYWLRKIHQQLNITTIFVTHDQEEALEMADTVVIMNKGEIEQIGSPVEVYNNPANEFVYKFLGRVNEFREDAFQHIFKAATKSRYNGEQIGYIRPHEIIVRKTPGGNAIASELSNLTIIGSSVRLELKFLGLPQLYEAEINLEKYEELGELKKGDILYADFENMAVLGNMGIERVWKLKKAVI